MGCGLYAGAAYTRVNTVTRLIRTLFCVPSHKLSYIVNPALRTLVLWEEEFFSSLSASTSQNLQDNDSDEDIVEVNAELKEPKVKSLKEAVIMLEDMTKYLTSENLTGVANDLSKVLRFL